MQHLNRDAACLARRFGLQYASIEAERANVTSRFGVCYSDGVIKIRLLHSVTRRPLKYSSLVSTLCHELAHLRHFNHGERFRVFYLQILEFAREQGIYRPALRGSRALEVSQRIARGPKRAPKLAREIERPGPVQLVLFD